MVLVSFATKKTVKHYVGNVTVVSEGVPTVEFARRVKNSSTFIWPHEEDQCEIETKDIVTFLPDPLKGRRGSSM